MRTGIPIFHQVKIIIIVAENDTDPASDRKIEPYNLIITPLVINRDTDLVDLAKKANPYLCNEEHKQEQERKQPNYR